jgi:hypothetical protein
MNAFIRITRTKDFINIRIGVPKNPVCTGMTSKNSISEKELGLKGNLSFIGKLLWSRECREET